MNSLYLFVEIIVCFAAVAGIAKAFGKVGLIGWIGVASVLANIITAKTSNILGLDAAQGSVLFASTFLATDILCEKYGKRSATIGVLFGLTSSVALIAATQIALLYTPVEYDYAAPSMEILFGLNLRITGSSIAMYLIANLADIAVFDKLRRMTGGKYLWLRNNAATILCNCVENFGFIFLAFYGIYSAGQCAEIAIATSVIEIVAAICDTPFAYLGRKYAKAEGD